MSRSWGLVMATLVVAGGLGILISKLPWQAAIAVSGYKRSSAKVRQTPPLSPLMGPSNLQNGKGKWGARLPLHWGYLMAHATEALQWDAEVLAFMRLFGIKWPLLKLSKAPRPNAVNTMWLVSDSYKICTGLPATLFFISLVQYPLL